MTEEKNSEIKCAWLNIIERQSMVEFLKREGGASVYPYKNRGCFICSGYNTHCNDYKSSGDRRSN
jgi:hypothetical protein